jgi:hypothetical protein
MVTLRSELSRLRLPASAASPGRRVCGWRAGEELLIRLVDSRAVSGGEQVQEKAADRGHAEPGVGPAVGGAADDGEHVSATSKSRPGGWLPARE